MSPTTDRECQRSRESFPSTHWTAITSAANQDAEPAQAQMALTELCQTYWPPLYSFVRSRGYSLHDAKDVTQAFFAFLIENKIYTRADREKGKFRWFLLASIKNFLADWHDREHALKRGGGHELIPFHEGRVSELETSLETDRSAVPNPDRVFDRAWAETIVRDGLKAVARHYETEGKTDIFQALRVFLTGSSEPLPEYTDLAARLRMPESTLRSNIARLRARYREALRTQVRRTVSRESEVEEELRELLRILTAS